MARSYRYISADSHWEVPVDKWTHLVPQQYRERAPRRVKLPHGGDGFFVEGRPMTYGGTGHYAGHTPEDFDVVIVDYDTSAGSGPPEQRLREQDADGIDAEIMYPGGGSQSVRAIADPGARKAIVGALNEYLAEYCSVAPDRLLALGVLANKGVEEDLAELEHIKGLGLAGIVMETYPSGKSVPSPEDDKFWATAVDMQMPVTIHTSFSRGPGRRGEFMLKYPIEPVGDMRPPVDLVDRMARYGTRHCGSLELCQMIMDGVFDRNPKLKIYWAENNIGWIPAFYEQMDRNYKVNRFWVERYLGWKPLKRLPSEYAREHAYWGFFDDPVGVRLRHDVGVDHILWGSDFPHEVCYWPNTMEVMEDQLAEVSADERRKMMADNAIEFFHLDR
jgi:predicted TIM-barrel fold metal-dependent hydrolase